MSQIRLIRVFLSSPGDVTEERQIALEVIERLPNRPAFREQVTFRVIAWDKPGAGTPMRATLTPQEAINKGLPRPSECDIVVVILWSRMGTPFTAENREYQSGTHWELLDALQANRPQTVIYRRTEKKLFEANDIEGQEQFKRVETFFKSDQFYDPDTGAIRRGMNAYKTPDDFRQQFETHFEELVVELLQRPVVDALPEPVPENTSNITTITTTPWIGSPFPGLRAFTPADAPIYFGRGQETDALVQRVASSRFVAVVGASGSGKSSLIGAGLIPRLKANAIPGSKDWFLPDWNVDARQWVGLRFTPGEVGDNPFMALALKLAPLTGDTPRDLAEKLAKTPAALTEIRVQLLRNKPDWAEALIFIDQFEELFTLVHPQYVAPFVDLLETAINSQLIRFVTTLRADFYARCVEVPKLADILEETTYPLAAPTHTELREMIIRPAEQAGLEFEERLPERILNDTGTEPGALALMAYALDELYHSGADDRRLTNTEYEALGGVQGAIGKRAETVFHTLQIEAQNALPTVFQEIVEVDERGEPTRRRAELRVVAPDTAAKRLVDALTGERARLLVQDKDGEGHPIVEVAHEALLRQWPRLRDWIEQEQDNLRRRRQIQQAAQEWEEHERTAGYLLMGSRLEDAERWLKVFSAGQLERDFVAASAETEARRKEEERKIARRVQNFQRASIVLGSMVVLAVIVTGFAGMTTITSINHLATAQFQLRYSQAEQEWMAARVLGLGALPPVMGTRVPADFLATVTAVAELNLWTPIVREFQGVEMVQVPTGCFFMGSASSLDEQPIHEVCFDRPFWVDQYEVTNNQFANYGGERASPGDWPAPEQPRTSITWFKARDFCDLRGVRLPTEAEWEYAARGPNSQAYPWGNRFVADNVVYSGNSGRETSVVGSRPGGVSWVGASDMSGNVWEWVSSAYEGYPYDPSDGREDLSRIDVQRVLRGGAFDLNLDFLRTAAHAGDDPSNTDTAVGFRCAHSE